MSQSNKLFTPGIDGLANVRRVENFPKEEMNALALDLTHEVYTHDEMYGPYCTLQDHVDCDPDDAYAYLADPRTLAEWTYSMRDFERVDGPKDGAGDLWLATDHIGGATKIYTRVAANAAARTVDFHCAWDQGDRLWMIYLMRVIPSPLVLDKPGCVILWTNCHHPYYDRNPFPEKAPAGRKVWVGDLWPFFYAGHYVELQNLKAILEHRHRERAAGRLPPGSAANTGGEAP